MDDEFGEAKPATFKWGAIEFVNADGDRFARVKAEVSIPNTSVGHETRNSVTITVCVPADPAIETVAQIYEKARAEIDVVLRRSITLARATTFETALFPLPQYGWQR